jgi:hypothetical protein
MQRGFADGDQGIDNGGLLGPFTGAAAYLAGTAHRLIAAAALHPAEWMLLWRAGVPATHA